MLRLKARSEIQINNDLVKVTKWSFPPRGETGWHLHQMDYVVVPQMNGELLLENVSENSKINLISGEAYFRKKGINHNVINNNDYDFIFLEIEIKS